MVLALPPGSLPTCSDHSISRETSKKQSSTDAWTTSPGSSQSEEATVNYQASGSLIRPKGINPAEQSLSYRVNYANTIVYICLRNPTGVRRNGLELDGVIMEPQRTTCFLQSMLVSSNFELTQQSRIALTQLQSLQRNSFRGNSDCQTFVILFLPLTDNITETNSCGARPCRPMLNSKILFVTRNFFLATNFFPKPWLNISRPYQAVFVQN